MKDLSKYKSLVFDCDGVILNSNKVKTQAFFEVAKPYGLAQAQDLVDYHIENGGISRYKKFAYFLTNIIKQQLDDDKLNLLLNNFASEVNKGLMECDIVSGLEELKGQTSHIPWSIVSGGDQKELREIFNKRQIAKFFDGGIFGSPDTKEEILSRELSKSNISEDALLLGDSKYDYLAAESSGLDFLFVSQWSEFRGYIKFCKLHDIGMIKSVNNLVTKRYI